MTALSNPSPRAVRFAIAGGCPGDGVLRPFDSARRPVERYWVHVGVGSAEGDGRDPSDARVAVGDYLATCVFGSEKCGTRVSAVK